MALRLRVVSEHATRLGEQATKVFGVHGGTIGRATDNEWILPDPERYLSGKHARVDFRAGTYVLVDTSSNGTYVNGAQVPLGKYHDYPLKDGDYVRLGEYELLVSIDKSNDFPPEESAIVAYDGQSPSSAVKKSTANDLGADLDLSQLLEPSDLSSADSGVRPRDAYGQAVPSRSDPPSHIAAEPEADASRHALAHDDPAAQGRRRQKRSQGRRDPSRRCQSRRQRGQCQPRGPWQNPVLFDGDFDVGLTAFCRGAGIDPQNISSEARAAALQLAGQLLRESVLGLMDLNQSRNEFRNRFRISPPANDGPESPLNFSRGVDEALVRLLTTLSTRAGSVEAIRQNFRELKAQNTAIARRHPRRVRGIPRTRRSQGTGGALRPGHQTRRLRLSEQGEVLGPVCRDVRGPGAAPRGRISACVHRDLRQGLRGEIAYLGSAAAQQLRRRPGRDAAEPAIRQSSRRRSLAPCPITG